MQRKAVSTNQAPAAIGPYSQAIRVGNILFCSGQIPLKPSGEMVTGSVAEQAEQVLKNLSTVIEAAGLGMHHVAKTTIYLTSMDDFAAVNEVYQRYFQDQPPARATVAVAALPKGAKVEIEAIAVDSA